MRVIFSVLLVLFISFTSPVTYAQSNLGRSLALENAPTVILFVYLDPTGVTDPVKFTEMIFNGLKEELETTNKVNVLSFESSQKILRNYIRENSSAENARESDLGFSPKKKDFIALAEEAGVDYVFYVSSRVTDQKMQLSPFAGFRAQQTIIIETLLFEKDTQQYLIDDIFSETGKGSYGNFDRAFNKALPKLIDQIDLSKVDFKKNEQ